MAYKKIDELISDIDYTNIISDIDYTDIISNYDYTNIISDIDYTDVISDYDYNDIIVAEAEVDDVEDKTYFVSNENKQFELIIEGGYRKFMLDTLEREDLPFLIERWIDDVLDDYSDISDDDLEELLESYIFYIFGEATYKDLRRDAPNYLRIRQKSKDTPGSKYITIDEDNILYFKTPSHTKEGVVYEQRVKLLELDKYISEYRGKKPPIEIVRMGLEGDIAVHCNDPSWKYWGFQYIGTVKNYALEKEPRYPKIRNPNLKGSVCKHLDNVLYILPFQNTKVLRDLRDSGRL